MGFTQKWAKTSQRISQPTSQSYKETSQCPHGAITFHCFLQQPPHTRINDASFLFCPFVITYHAYSTKHTTFIALSLPTLASAICRRNGNSWLIKILLHLPYQLEYLASHQVWCQCTWDPLFLKHLYPE